MNALNTGRLASSISSNRFSVLRMSSSSATSREYAPSQHVLDDETGEKWRLCSGAVVLNSRNEVLVGERVGLPDNWQCAQGGVDDEWTSIDGVFHSKETIVGACSRELYEEMGLQVGIHVVVDPTFPNSENGRGVRYSTTGTSNWLTKAGFVGQELHWTLYRCIDSRGDLDPSIMCDLSGRGGEDAEFTNVKWQPIADVVKNIWEKKREPYQYLKQRIDEYATNWQTIMISKVEFTGKWSRENNMSIGVVEGLVARGLSKEAAAAEFAKPYIQSYSRIEEDKKASPFPAWEVTTYATDGNTIRRQLEYCVGEWAEDYDGEAVLFGSGPETLKRHTLYVAEPLATPIPVAHATITETPQGRLEESRRYIRGDTLIVKRTLWSNPTDLKSKGIECTEVFTRIDS